MISVLIPVYNYDISSLVKELHLQLVAANFGFEIICLDDKSNVDITTNNSNVSQLPNVSYLTSETNNGIAITRQKLVESATYKWVMLLDADTKISEHFISAYLAHIDTKYDFVFGGFKYNATPPDNERLLRWKYGKKREAVLAELRNKNPYKVTIAANLLARKEAYLKLGLNSIGNNYAMDYFFGAKLKATNAKVLHINNQVIHLGIESSSSYLLKKERAVDTLLKLHKQKEIEVHSNDLLKAFLFSKRIGLNYLLSVWFRIFNSSMTANLIGKNPSINVLQLYKLSYMCFRDLNTPQKDLSIDS